MKVKCCSIILSIMFCFAFCYCLTANAKTLSENHIYCDTVSDNNIETVMSNDVLSNDFGYTESDDIEPESSGSTFLSATPIQVNEVCRDILLESRSENYYQFSLQNPGVISISIMHELYDSDEPGYIVHLYNNAHQEMDSFTSSNGYSKSKTGSQIGLPAGSYYVMISYYTVNNLGYSFQVNYTESNVWEKEYNGSWLTANPIWTNTQYNGSITIDDSEDYYVFTLPAAGVVSLTISHDIYESDYSGWIMYLYNSAHNEIYRLYSSDGYTNSKVGAKIGLPPGTYYVMITDYIDDDYRSYSFAVSYLRSDVWEREYNDSWLSADNINIGTTYCGANLNKDDEDYFKFSADYSGFARIVFGHVANQSMEQCWMINIYDENHNYYDGFFSNEGYNRAFVSHSTYFTKGIYYVVVSEYSNTYESAYSLQVRLQPAEGTVVNKGNLKYKVLGTGPADSKVECIASTSKKVKSIVVPSTITIDGFTYDVTSIAKDAFKNCKKIGKVVIGTRVKVIGTNAFSGCTKLKTIHIKSKSITKVGKNALKNIHKNAKIKVPKSVYSKYKKLFKKKGQKSSVRIVK